VIDAKIEGNTIVDCMDAILLGNNEVEDATLAPMGTIFERNSVIAREGRPAVRVERSVEGTKWKDNSIEGALEGMDEVEGVRGGALPAVAAPKADAQSFGASWMKRS
jgi:hypothetical protein